MPVAKVQPSLKTTRRGIAPEPSTPNIREVARLAGVSLGTVSHVLNRPEIVRPALRERVRQVIQACGYRPNAVAKSLRQRRTMTIGLVLSDITTPFASKVARVVEDLAMDAEMSVVFADTDERIDREERAIRTFFDKGVDGVIVAPAPGNHGFLSGYLARGWPVVVINRQIDTVVVPAVLPDNVGGAAAATRHMIDHGHRRIGIVVPSARPSSVQERIEGHEQALRTSGIQRDKRLLVADDASVQVGMMAARRLLELGRPPTAILSFSSVMTLGVIATLRESGAKVPDDVALIGFDEASWSVAVAPSLTSVDLCAEAVGQTAAGLLFDWIASRQLPPRLEHRIPTRLLARQSCGCTNPPSKEIHESLVAISVSD
jgi:LacI family transcriptional regulator